MHDIADELGAICFDHLCLAGFDNRQNTVLIKSKLGRLRPPGPEKYSSSTFAKAYFAFWESRNPIDSIEPKRTRINRDRGIDSAGRSREPPPAGYRNNNTITTPQMVRSVLATAKQTVQPNAGTPLWAAS